MTVKLRTEKHLEFLRLIGGCTGSSESILVKMNTLLEISCRRFFTGGSTSRSMRGSRNFRQGGGSRSVRRKSSDNFFFSFSPQLILQKSNGQFQRNLSFFKVQEGVQHFAGGGGGGSNFCQGGPIAYTL